MPPDESCCRACLRGLYGCYWRHPSDRKRRHARCWFAVITLATLVTLGWMYICLFTYNDRDDVNWKGFMSLQHWVNWFMVVIIIAAVLCCYAVLLLLFAFFQIALREPLDLHWLHKIFLVLGILLITLGVIGISCCWKGEWPTVLLSLQATAPFLQIGGVGALTLLSLPVFTCYHRAHRKGSKGVILVVFALVSGGIFLSPLLIHSPCLIDLKDLPARPALIGHRGAPMLAPENTMMSFNESLKCNVMAFETDVQLSNDRVPFLMHDHGTRFLKRTTNATGDINSSVNLTWEELQGLNAGDWFLKKDPFLSVWQLSAEDREKARKQTIPSLLQLLDLAAQKNTSVIFDLKNVDNEGTADTVALILSSGIPQSLVLWLPSSERDYVKEKAPGFIHVYDNKSEMVQDGGDHLNLKYSSISATEIRELRKQNVSVNLWVVNERWLFSLLWCSGASSVTTNSCQLLQHMTEPDWTLKPKLYLAIWITVDIVSLIIMSGLFLLLKKREAEEHIFSLESERTLPLLTY